MLTSIIFIPLIGAVLIGFLLPRHWAKEVRWVSLGVTLVNLALALALFDLFVVGVEGFQFEENVSWITTWNVRYHLGVDGLSLLLVILTNLLGVAAVLCSFNSIQKRQKEYYIFLLVLQTGILGTFLALDLFLFYIFWELMLIPLYFLIGIWGSGRRIYATLKFVLFTMVGSVLMLLGIITLYLQYKYTFGQGTFEYQKLLELTPQLSGSLQFWLFLALFLAFAIKVPLFPFHTWLPDAHTEAPTAGSVVLAGVLLKTGAYGILRFCIPLFPKAAVQLSPYIIWLAIIGIIYGALTAAAQKDMKRLVAYSSVSHMGFVILGIFSFISLGVSGGILQMVNHGISTGGLFLVVGILYERRHTRLMSDFGGIAHQMKAYTVLSVIIVLSSLGLPGLNGFVGEVLILIGAFKARPLFGILGATGVILAAWYLLLMVQKVFYGPLDNPKNKRLKDINFREWCYLLPVVFLAFWIGIYPNPLLKIIEPSTRTILRAVELEVPEPQLKFETVATSSEPDHHH